MKLGLLKGESEDAFVTRFCADEELGAFLRGRGMTPEATARAFFRMGQTKTLDAEIFAVGKWNGYQFSVRDLEEIVAAFNKLSEKHKVPLKFGHNDTQPMTDGQPALGWVDKLWLDRTQTPVKMLARFTDVPEVVYQAMQSKKYRKVSVELDFDVEHMGAKYSAVLSGVALLGADLPAVNVLADLDAYMSRNGTTDYSVIAKRRQVFTYEQRGVTNMDELQKAQQDVARLTTENAQLKAQISLLTVEKENFSRRESEREAADKREKLTRKRSEINEWCEAQVKAGTMLPAQREQFKVAVGFDNDEALLAANIEPWKKMFTVQVKAPGSDGQGAGAGTGQDSGTGESATTKVIRLTRERMASQKLSFEAAMEQVLRADAALDKAYGEELRKEGA